MVVESSIYDLYLIGSKTGFYVGQAKRLPTGGWERRVAMHRAGKGGSIAGASALLQAGAKVRCIGSIATDRAYANVLEARAWDLFRARGWKPAHPRPRDSANWASGGGTFTKEHAAKISAKLQGRRLSLEHCENVRRALLWYWIGATKRGRKHTPEARAKISIAMRGHFPWSKGQRLSPETRARMRVAWVKRKARAAA